MLNKLEKIIPILTILAFVLGIFVAALSKGTADIINGCVSKFIDSYGYIAPLAIFLILAPSLARILKLRKEAKFGGYILWWLGVSRFFACIWAVVFTTLIFGLPLVSARQNSLGTSLIFALKSFFEMATHSSYFFAIYIGIIVSIISLRVAWVYRLLDKSLSAIEYLGQYFQLIVPIFMLAMGAYIYGLANTIESQLRLKDLSLHLGKVNFLGLGINPHTTTDILIVYVAGALLVGIACFIWHFSLMLLTKYKIKDFSIRKYFSKYWIKVYPLLWATSSEALATPLNLHLTKKHFPHIRGHIRQFVVGIGSYLGINGTLICVFVLLGVVTDIMGYRLSFMELLFCVPIVFLIGYGIPGIPGELVLFAGPIAILLNLPQAIVPAFLAFYCGLQFGLPDSFRSGGNSTDNVLSALLINNTYEKRLISEIRGHHRIKSCDTIIKHGDCILNLDCARNQIQIKSGYAYDDYARVP